MTTTRTPPATATTTRADDGSADDPVRGTRRYVVLYDRECAFCTASARRLGRWDRRRVMQLVPLQDARDSADPAVREAAATRPLAQALHVVDRETGRVDVGGRAVLTLLDALPGGPLLRPWTVLPATTAIAEVAYGVVSDRRADLGWAVGLRHEVACPVHGEEPIAARR